jgi:hypothetical protein
MILRRSLKKNANPGPATYTYKPYVAARERKSTSFTFFKNQRMSCMTEIAKNKEKIPAPGKYQINEATVYKPMRKF